MEKEHMRRLTWEFKARYSAKTLADQAPTQPACQNGWSRIRVFFLALLGLLTGALSGCRTVIPAVDLKEPGWTLHQGQAVWHFANNRGGELAGDLLVATRPEGEAFVQFSKPPFPLVTAQATTKGWRVEFPPQNKHYAGRGTPPHRLIWLYLPRVLTGKLPPENWTWKQEQSGWRLENHENDEAVEGYFDQ